MSLGRLGLQTPITNKVKKLKEEEQVHKILKNKTQNLVK